MRILNLYAGIGGNRSHWGDEHEITAIEYDPNIAAIYKDRFPNDKVLIEDAHEYLLKHYKEFDFIWSSPPCQTHSSFRFNIGVRYRGTEPKYPDMTLYQEIIFLNSHFEGKWVVENVKPYYEPLLQPQSELQRHYFWANFELPELKFEADKIRSAQIPDLQLLHQIDLSDYKLANKRQVLRNCVLGEVGKYVLDCGVKNA